MYVSMSADANCLGIRSPHDGHIVMDMSLGNYLHVKPAPLLTPPAHPSTCADRVNAIALPDPGAGFVSTDASGRPALSK